LETNSSPTNPLNQFKPRWDFPDDGPGATKTWRITYGAEACQLPELDGAEYISRILGGEARPLSTAELAGWQAGGIADEGSELFGSKPDLAQDFGNDSSDAEDPEGGSDGGMPVRGGSTLGFQTSPSREAMRALSTAKIKQVIAELNKEARAADAAGDKLRYNELQTHVIAARKYLSTTTALGGKSRRFPDQYSRDSRAVREAISRAIEAIRKQAPAIAAHLDSAITNSHGAWRYTAPDRWDLETESPLSSPAGWEWTETEEDPEVLKIRRSWMFGKIGRVSMETNTLQKWQRPTPPGPTAAAKKELLKSLTRKFPGTYSFGAAAAQMPRAKDPS
jgi:hypothetical protein